MDLIEALSFQGENTTEQDKKRKILNTLEFLQKLEEDSDEEVQKQPLSKKVTLDQLLYLDLSVKLLVKIESNCPFEIQLSSKCNMPLKTVNSSDLLLEWYYSYSPELAFRSVECFQKTTNWILEKISSRKMQEVYFYAVNLGILFFVSGKGGLIHFYLPKTILSLRKYISKYIKNLVVETDISEDNSFASSIQFSCTIDVAKEVLFNLSSLSQKDSVLDILSTSPFIYATIMPNESSYLKKTTKITQKWNETTNSSEIVEFTSYSQSFTGCFSERSFTFQLAKLLIAQGLSNFIISFDNAAWSLHSNSIKLLEYKDSLFDIEFEKQKIQ